MPGSKTPIEHDTLTFVDEEMNYQDVMNLFKPYGTIKSLNKYINRFFIQFESLDQAREAKSELGRNYRVAFAHAKTKPRPKKNFRPEGELIRLSNPADLPKCGRTAPKNTNTNTNTNTKTSTNTNTKTKTKTNTANCLAMIQEYVSTSARRHTSSASTQNEEARSNENPTERDRELENQTEKPKGSQNGPEMARGSENRREMAKSSGNHSQSANQNQHGRPANHKPNSSQVQDPEYDDSDDSDDNMEEPEAQKPKAQKRPGEAGEDEQEEEDDDQDENEEDQQPEARALEAGTHRRVRIEGLDEIMQELGSDMAYSVIVANIPERYTLEEVYDLVEEVRPIAFSEMDYSIKMRVKFCEVFLNDAADVDYLKRKLNDFVICGKQLTVMEPAEILDETRWNA